MKRVLIGVLTFMLILGLVAGFSCKKETPTPTPTPTPKPTPTPTPKPTPKVPKVLKMTCYPVGSSGYAFSAGIAEGVKKVSGIEIKVIPGGTDAARLLPVRAREAHLFLVTGATGYFASHGLAYFAAPEWGPQPIVMVWRGEDLPLGWMTRGDSGIKTAKDLKGKRVARVPASPAITKLNEALLAFAGLTWDDVTPVEYGSYTAALKGVIEGSCDMCGSQTTSSAAIELAGSVHGIHWIPVPPEDKEGWARLQKVAPYIVPTKLTIGAGISPDKPYQGGAYPYNIFAYPWLPDDIAYAVTKAIWEAYSIYKDKHPDLKYWDHDHATKWEYLRACPYPYHPGSVKFFKEIGVWSKEAEEWQKEQVKLAEIRAKAWEEAKAKAKEKKIKIGSDEWKKFWADYLKKKLDEVEVKYSLLK